jgi:hypothetical protein
MFIRGRVWRALALIALMFLVLICSTVLVFFGLSLGRAYGWVGDRQIEVTAQAVVTSILGIAGLVGAVIAFDRNMLESRALRARFAFDINQAFFRSDSEREFFYRIEHEQFRFVPEEFSGSQDERDLDRILYRLSLVGKLLRDGVLRVDDIKFMKYIARSVLTNLEVQKYLLWLKSEAADDGSFLDTMVLYRMAFGRKDANYQRIRECLC